MATRRPKPDGRVAVLAAVFAAMTASACQSCAYTYFDANGDRHAVGLMDITLRAPRDLATVAGDVIELTAIGVSVGQTAQGGYLTVGFSREATAALRDNALVIGNPISALSQGTKEPAGEQR